MLANSPLLLRDSWSVLFTAWLMALVATFSALFIGEVMGQTPCQLCWYQRIAMFPLVLILGIACIKEDFSVYLYALPLASAGGLIALWHNLLFFGVIPETIHPCGEGPSCSSADMTILGGLPLPALSLVAFAVIFFLLLDIRRKAPL